LKGALKSMTSYSRKDKQEFELEKAQSAKKESCKLYLFPKEIRYWRRNGYIVEPSGEHNNKSFPCLVSGGILTNKQDMHI